VLGALALVIGVVGIYSVVSYSVTRRQTEFGVRLALGASPRRILREVIGGGLVPIGIGVTAGVAGTLALGSTINRFLYGVGPADAASLATAAAALLGAGLLAAAVPAIRAGRTDPVKALRAD
jgi:putative ABC transport system permease protein